MKWIILLFFPLLFCSFAILAFFSRFSSFYFVVIVVAATVLSIRIGPVVCRSMMIVCLLTYKRWKMSCYQIHNTYTCIRGGSWDVINVFFVYIPTVYEYKYNVLSTPTTSTCQCISFFIFVVVVVACNLGFRLPPPFFLSNI